MKKSVIISIVIIIFLALIGTGAFFLISKDAMIIQNPVILQQNALITYVIGESFFKEEESQEWIELEIGQKLKVGFILKTLENGEIDIRFSENTLMKMDNNTILQISENTLKNLKVDVNDGRLFAKFHKLFSDQEFQVTSGNSVAGIRGTDLVFESANSKTNIYALSGITEVYNNQFSKDRILLAYQMKTEIPDNAPPAQPERMEASLINKFQNILNIIHSEKVFLISNNIQFEANTANILPGSIPELEIVFNAMKLKSFKIEIAGHTANYGSSSAMYDLSLLRAQAIKDYLVELGISEKRLTIRGYGGSKPIADNGTEAGKAKNRRVEFIILED